MLSKRFLGAAAAAVAVTVTPMVATLTPANATPSAPSVEPGGVVRVDIPAGEWWYCQALSLSAPFVEYAPGYYQYGLGPAPLYFRFPAASDVWINCNGSGTPFVYFAPVVRTL